MVTHGDGANIGQSTTQCTFEDLGKLVDSECEDNSVLLLGEYGDGKRDCCENARDGIAGHGLVQRI